ncbi:MAG: NADH-quinone oxidoreductase subunit H [Deltaproteobacteria bacterium]|nr:NADH-quinone oxidoreductase subunit H [Deltaproteobacteria bacterium]
MLEIVLSLTFAALFPPLMLGIVTRIKAYFAGRVGAPILQPYFDLAKLLRKGTVRSRSTTWVFFAGPVAGVVTLALAAQLVPHAGQPALVSFRGDFILVVYLLALGRFATMASALDSGSAFEGMGAAREASYSALAEPALILGLLALARASGSLALSDMLGPSLRATWVDAGVTCVLVAAAFTVVLLVETSRIPFDDPNTHLELTMIHEVMVLDHGGPALALIEYASALKLFVLGSIVARVLCPISFSDPSVDLLVAALSLLGVSVAIGVVESTMARLKLVNVPRALVGACLLSALGVVLLGRTT